MNYSAFVPVQSLPKTYPCATEKMRDFPTARRSELKAAMREAVRKALLALVDRRGDEREAHEFNPWESNLIFTQVIKITPLIPEDDEVCAPYSFAG